MKLLTIALLICLGHVTANAVAEVNVALKRCTSDKTDVNICVERVAR